MTSLGSMLRNLERLCIYNLDESSVVYAETAAMSLGVDYVRAQLELLLREAFLNTAEDFGIVIYEKETGAPRDDLPLEKRREMIGARHAMHKEILTVSSVKNTLKALGAEGEIQEYPFSNALVINLMNDDYTDEEKEWLCEQLEKFMPAHLDISVQFCGLVWKEIDAMNNTFAYMDEVGLSWKEIDLYKGKE